MVVPHQGDRHRDALAQRLLDGERAAVDPPLWRIGVDLVSKEGGHAIGALWRQAAREVQAAGSTHVIPRTEVSARARVSGPRDGRYPVAAKRFGFQRCAAESE